MGYCYRGLWLMGEGFIRSFKPTSWSFGGVTRVLPTDKKALGFFFDTWI